METHVARTRSPERHSSNSPNEASYAFLNHSTSTLTNNLPPTVDNKALARQKRKRTSPEDQAVLEAAYQRDPKPDRAARQDVVRKVALGEKEVQIWFQNRRQSSRRKSRPLLPHEIAQYQATRSSFSSPTIPSSLELDSFTDNSKTHTDGNIDSAQVDSAKECPPAEKLEVPDAAPVRKEDEAVEAGDKCPAAQTMLPEETAKSTWLTSVMIGEAQPRPTAYTGEPPSIGYLANRRNEALLRMGLEDPVKPEVNQLPSIHPERQLEKARSFVRLSMTSEGNARVLQDTMSPSPPRPSQGSQDTSGPHNSSDVPITAPQVLQRIASGRSRDSRAWEFWCDKDARTELAEKAEKDGSGSAADAIGLMRSNSGRRVLGAIPSKRNFILGRHASGLKRTKIDHRRPSLQRANTSTGRLQGQQRPAVPGRSGPKHSESAVSIYIPGNESDKENWSPNGMSQISCESGAKAIASDEAIIGRAVLSEERFNKNVGVKRLHASSKPRTCSDSDPENDPELTAFMNSGRKSSSVTEEEDLTCVQGLLSLSQGNWR